MAIFNSLGSNYTLGFAARALFAGNRDVYKRELVAFLEKRYRGRVVLTYKGREALRLALRAIAKAGSSVGICGYTCYAVYDAVVKEGYRARYFDIAEGDIHFSFETVREGIRKDPSITVLIVQNTLGFPGEIEKIAAFCKERKIILIEDLAHSIGARYAGGLEAGTVGDMTVLSFSQDKMVDGVSGGALVLRDKNFQFKIFNFQKINKRQQIRDRLYPLFTWVIRKTYDWGVGKGIHAFLKRFHLLSLPMGHLEKEVIYDLPNWYCRLIYWQFLGLEEDLRHRRKIASIYGKELDGVLVLERLVKQIGVSSNLRFPILVKKRSELIAFLKGRGIFVSDIWYDSPVAPRRFLHLTDYSHECPNSERVSEMLLNLPTHRNVSEGKARFIASMVNEWREKFSI